MIEGSNETEALSASTWHYHSTISNEDLHVHTCQACSAHLSSARNDANLITKTGQTDKQLAQVLLVHPPPAPSVREPRSTIT